MAGMVPSVLRVARVQQGAGKRHTSTAEQIFSPDGLSTFDQEGSFFGVFCFTAPDANTISTEQLFDIMACYASASGE